MIPDSAIPAILLSGVVAGVLLLVAGLLGRRGQAAAAQVAAALAVAAGYLTGTLMIQGRPSVPPADVQDWLVLLVPAAAAVGAIQGTVRSTWIRLVAHALYTAVAGALVLKPLFGSWSTAEAILSGGGLLAVSVGLASALAVGGDRLAPRWVAVATFAFAVGSSVLMVVGGSVRLGLLGGVVAATAGAAVAVALLGLGLEKGRALTGTVGALATLLWTRGYFYSALKPAAQATYVAALVLLALVPLAALLGDRLTKGTVKPGKATLIRLALVGAPVVLALGLALATAPRFAPTEAGGEDY